MSTPSTLEIQRAFCDAKSVTFCAKPYNYFGWRSMWVGDFYLPLEAVFSALEIPAQALRDVFSGSYTRSHKPWWLIPFWHLLPSYWRETAMQAKVPEKVKNYNQLGSCNLELEPFLKLAKILGKPVEVVQAPAYPQDPAIKCFTALPSDEVINNRD